MLQESDFDKSKSDELIYGFKNGFDIGYRGPMFRNNHSANIPLRIGSQQVLWGQTHERGITEQVCRTF